MAFSLGRPALKLPLNKGCLPAVDSGASYFFGPKAGSLCWLQASDDFPNIAAVKHLLCYEISRKSCGEIRGDLKSLFKLLDLAEIVSISSHHRLPRLLTPRW